MKTLTEHLENDIKNNGMSKYMFYVLEYQL